MSIDLGDLVINLLLEDDKLKKDIQEAESELTKFEAKVDKIGRGIRNFGAGLTAAFTLPLIAAAGFAIKAASEMEVLELQFKTMLGSEQLALSLLEDIKKFSLETPFQIQEIANASGILIAMGRTVVQVREDIKSIGDVAAGTPASLEDLTSIFAKIIGLGKVQAEELRQLIERRIPILEVLGKMLGKTSAELFKMAEKGQITSDIIVKAFKQMSGEGGRFENLMQKMSQTVQGLWSNVKVFIELASIEFGNMIIKTFELKKTLRGLMDTMGRLTMWIQNLDENTRKGILGFLLFLIVIGPIIAAVGILILAIKALVVAFFTLHAFLLTFSLNPIVVAIILVIAVIGLLIAAWIHLAGEGETFFDKMKDLMGNDITSWEHWANTVSSIFLIVAQNASKLWAHLKNGWQTVSIELEKNVFLFLANLEKRFTKRTPEEMKVVAAQVAALDRKQAKVDQELRINLKKADGLTDIFLKATAKGAGAKGGGDQAVADAFEGLNTKMANLVDIRSEAAFLTRNNINQTDDQKNLAANEKTAVNSAKLIKSVDGLAATLKETKPITTGVQ